MLDRRQSARDEFIYGGVAEIGDDGATRDCVVRNISEQGARIEFSTAVKLHKKQMSVAFARKGRSFLARVVWWRDNFAASPSALRPRRRPYPIWKNGCA